MKISFDAAKRDATLQDRGVDFADAAEVFFRPGVRDRGHPAELGRVPDAVFLAVSWPVGGGWVRATG
jgi:uncharacterized DUF497 family protein